MKPCNVCKTPSDTDICPSCSLAGWGYCEYCGCLKQNILLPFANEGRHECYECYLDRTQEKELTVSRCTKRQAVLDMKDWEKWKSYCLLNCSEVSHCLIYNLGKEYYDGNRENEGHSLSSSINQESRETFLRRRFNIIT